MSDKIQKLIYLLLKELGENPKRKEIQKTPFRTANALREITSGYHADIDKVLNGAFYKTNNKEMIVVKDITFHSLCEHHLLPFIGKVHVAYIPNGKIIGLSKIPRLVQVFANRLQVQERLTEQIANTLNKKLMAKGVGVVIEARHLCMTMRGIKSENSLAVTSSMLGVFKKNNIKEEFFNLIKK
jgi:GTP cyclohydrolase I